MPRGRGRGRRGGDGRFAPNLTPLLDVVLQLITFFMMLVHFGTRIEGATDLVRLPAIPAALPRSELAVDRLAVAIDDQGRLLVDGRSLEGEQAAAAWWEQEALRRGAGQRSLGAASPDLRTQVIVRADRDATYGSVRRALAVAQKVGFVHYSLIVKRERP
jgi:biopolymer transport protein ExbD